MEVAARMIYLFKMEMYERDFLLLSIYEQGLLLLSTRVADDPQKRVKVIRFSFQDSARVFLLSSVLLSYTFFKGGSSCGYTSFLGPL